jgi:hypothetical protein
MTAPALSPFPGVVVTTSSGAATFGDPTDPAVIFLHGLTEQGPTDPVEHRSFAAWTQTFGARAGNEAMYDSADLIFRRLAAAGGGRVITRRRVGPAAAVAELTLQDATPADAVTFTALGPGAYANGATGGLKVRVEAATVGAGRKVSVLVDDQVVEVWDNLDDQDELIAAFDLSQYLRAADAGSGLLPAVAAATSLAGGDDDRDAVDDTTLTADLAAVPRSLGIGRVVVPGVGTTTAHQKIIDHGVATNRRAALSVPAAATPAVVKPLRALLADYPGAWRADIYCGEGVTLPAAVPGGPARTIDGGAVAAAVGAVSFLVTGHTINAAAGDYGTIPEATGVALDLTSEEWTDLYANQVNPIIFDTRGRRTAKIYGDRTVSSDPVMLNTSAAMSTMWLQARLEAMGEQFLFGDPTTRAKIERFAAAGLAEMDRDAAAGAFNDVGPNGQPLDTPSYSFDVSLTTGQVVAAGQLIGRAAVTWARTTEQIVIPIFAQAIA